jgi:hypothetical protein
MLKIKCKILKAIKIFISLTVFFNIAHATEFPKSLEERKQDKMGSILGDDGLQLSINKADNTSLNSTKKTSRQAEEVNYIWLAALESVKFMPLNSADFNGGVIITDWISNDKRPTERFKISIYIKGKALSLNSFEVNIYGEEFKKGRWTPDRNKHEFLKTKMTNDILLLAKELQAQNKRNR